MSDPHAPERTAAVNGRVDRLTTGPRSTPLPDAERAASALRDLVRYTVTAQEGAPLGALADALDALVAGLEVPPPTTSRYGEGAWDLEGGLQPNERGTHPMIGPANPSAPPLRLVADGPRTAGTIVFGPAQEGPVGCAHGGWIAAVFDMLLATASAASLTGGGFTGTLTVRYVGLTPIGVPLSLSGWVDRVEGRKIFVRGTIHRPDGEGPDALCAEAEAIFVGSKG